MTRQPLLRHHPYEPSMQAAGDRIAALHAAAPMSTRRGLVASLRDAIGARLVWLGAALMVDEAVRRRAARRRQSRRQFGGQLGVGPAAR